MRDVRCAIVESRSWPKAGSPDESIYGYRSYRFSSSCNQYAISIDIISPFSEVQKGYHYYFISDDLCDSGFPAFIPYRNRVALLKESPKYISQLHHDRISKLFPHILTNIEFLALRHDNFRLVPFSSNFLGIDSRQSGFSLPSLEEKSKLCSMIANLGHDLQEDGYSMRMSIFRLAQNSAAVDIYGRATRPIHSKAEALRPYCFSVAMENNREDLYFTEKIIDCILCGTIPVYYGCPSISHIFDSRGILSFSCKKEFNNIIGSLSFDLYRDLRRYVEWNVSEAFARHYDSFEGYLKRAMSCLLGRAPSPPTPYRLRYGIGSKIMRRYRLVESFTAT